MTLATRPWPATTRAAVESLCAMFIVLLLTPYGLGKVFRTQFGLYPSLPLSDTNVADITGWEMVWMFHGRSAAYESFLGLVEMLCVALVLFRRTRALGAVATLGAMTNVTLINAFYGVPALTNAAALLVAALVIVILNLPVYKEWFAESALRAAPVWPDAKPLRVVGIALKTVALLLPLGVVGYVLLVAIPKSAPGPLYGKWRVTAVDSALPSAPDVISPRVGTVVYFDAFKTLGIRIADTVNFGTYSFDSTRQTIDLSIFATTLRDYHGFWRNRQPSYLAWWFRPDRLRHRLVGSYSMPDRARLVLSVVEQGRAHVLSLSRQE